MTNFSLRIKGLASLQRALKKSPELFGKYVVKALKTSAYDITAKTLPVTPIDTGRLRGGVGEAGSSGLQVTKTRAVMGPRVNYAVYVHEGTKFMPGRPFYEKGMRAALGMVKENFAKAVHATFQDIKRRVTKF